MLIRDKSRVCALLLVAALLGGALAGCGGGGSSKVSAGTYVKSICAAVGPFERDVQSRSSALNLSNISNPAQGKQALRSFLNAVVADTDKAVSKLKSAGTPNVTNGKQISGALVNAFSRLRSALERAANGAAALPTGTPQAFKSAAASLGTTVQGSMSAIGSSLSGLRSPDLERAAAKEPTCRSLAAA
jgi:hypothetical protein